MRTRSTTLALGLMLLAASACGGSSQTDSSSRSPSAVSSEITDDTSDETPTAQTTPISVSGPTTSVLEAMNDVSRPLPSADSQGFWSTFGIMASPSASLLEGYDDLEVLTRSVDVVVVARIAGVDEPRVVSPDGDTVYVARILLDVEEVLAGVRVDQRSDGLLALEELTGTHDMTDELARSFPEGRAIYFLRSRAHFATGAEQLERLDFYVVPIPAAIVTEVDGLAEVPRAVEFSPIADQTRGRDFEELLAEVRGYGKLEPIPVDLYQIGEYRTVYDLVELSDSRGP